MLVRPGHRDLDGRRLPKQDGDSVCRNLQAA